MNFLVELQYFKSLGNSFHNFGPFYLMDLRPIVCGNYQISCHHLISGVDSTHNK